MFPILLWGTHWCRDKIVAIWQTTFSYQVSLSKWLCWYPDFRENWFQGSSWRHAKIVSVSSLATKRRQAIIWICACVIYRRIMHTFTRWKEQSFYDTVAANRNYHLPRESSRMAMKAKRVVQLYPNYLSYDFSILLFQTNFKKKTLFVTENNEGSAEKISLKTSSTMLSIFQMFSFCVVTPPTAKSVRSRPLGCLLITLEH